MAPPSYQLVMRTGPTPGKSYALDKDEIRIGRDISNDVVINDAEVSRKHARMIVQASGYVLEDLGSTNGTFVDGKRLTGPHSMTSGETILLGENVSLTFQAAKYDPDATMVGSGGQWTTPPTEIEYPGETYAPETPPSQPVYSGQIPQYEPLEPEEEKKASQTWLYVGCGCLVVLVCVVVGALLWYIDSRSLWCELFPFLAGC
jgi:hypothetical protein